MPDPDKTSGGHMHQKTPYKFNAGNGQFLPLSFFPVILNRKSNIFIIHMDDAVIADSDPMGILSKVINHRLCTVKSFLTVRNPFCVVTGIYKFFEFIMITVFFCCSMKLKLEQRAQEAKKRAEEMIAKGGLSDHDYKIVEAKLQRALVRLSVKS